MTFFYNSFNIFCNVIKIDSNEGLNFESVDQQDRNKDLNKVGHKYGNGGLSPPRTTFVIKSSLLNPLNGTVSVAICHNIIPKL